MLRNLVSAFATEKQKRFLRRSVNAARSSWASVFFRYDAPALVAALRGMGVVATDTLLVHANFRTDSGFRGTPNDVVSALIDVVGERGNLMMVSQPFRGYAYDYLLRGKPFNVDKTVSMMGLITEMFRRRPGTRRSLHPTHPVLVFGRDAAALVAGHEDCLFPCGTGTPFAKLQELNGKILFYDVGTGANTFFHHVEDCIKEKLGFPLYDERLFEVPVIDAQGRPRVVRTYTFAKGATRHTDRLEAEMDRENKLLRGKVGNSSLVLVNTRDVYDVMTQMVEAGRSLIEPPAR